MRSNNIFLNLCAFQFLLYSVCYLHLIFNMEILPLLPSKCYMFFGAKKITNFETIYLSNGLTDLSQISERFSPLSILDRSEI